MTKVLLLHPVHHDGVRHEAGTYFEGEDEVVKDLITAGAACDPKAKTQTAGDGYPATLKLRQKLSATRHRRMRTRSRLMRRLKLRRSSKTLSTLLRRHLRPNQLRQRSRRQHQHSTRDRLMGVVFDLGRQAVFALRSGDEPHS